MRTTLLVGVLMAFLVLIPLSYPGAGANRALAEGSSITRGDVNEDGEVNSIDALLALQFEAGILLPPPYPDKMLRNGDLNDDGILNSVDASLILQFHAGLTHSL